MSRNWERMVSKNKKSSNKLRVKSGKEMISASTKEQMEVFLGRSWIFSSFLVGVAFLFLIAYGGLFQKDKLYWVTVICYLLLGIFYYLRRPYLKVGKTQISTRKFGVEKRVNAADIIKITIEPAIIAIQVKGMRTKIVCSRWIHRYPIAAMSERLTEFARTNHIQINEPA